MPRDLRKESRRKARGGKFKGPAGNQVERNEYAKASRRIQRNELYNGNQPGVWDWESNKWAFSIEVIGGWGGGVHAYY